MNQYRKLSTALLLVLLTACSSSLTELEIREALKEAKVQEAKAIVAKQQYKVQATSINGLPLRHTFKVTTADIMSYISEKQSKRSLAAATLKIEPVIYKNDTIMYLVNSERGWKLFSADKRMPIVLAENFVETGKTVTSILNNEALSTWISDIAGLTAYLSQTDEYDDKSESLTLWSAQSRGIKRIPYQPVPGEYIYVGREETSRKTFYVPHITKTLWHGGTPFNQYIPYKSAESTEHCDAGCVAVSTSQYMYYLQDQQGYSFQMPMLCLCAGPWNENYIQNFSGFFSWNLKELALTDDTSSYTPSQLSYVACSIAYLGKEMGIKYGPDKSTVSYLAAQNFLNKNNVKGKFVEGKDIHIYDIVGEGKHPVLTYGANSARNAGHMFLIDGCKYDEVEYDEVWRFLEDTTFYDPDRYGVILREHFKEKTNYSYLCNHGQNTNFWSNGSDADDTYYQLPEIKGYNTYRRYFKLEK